MKNPECVMRFAELMIPFMAEGSPGELGRAAWLSTPDLILQSDDPDIESTVWHFGRWIIENFKVEAAHIDPPRKSLRNPNPDAGLWEGGPQVWPHIKYTPYLKSKEPLQHCTLRFNCKPTYLVN